MLQLYKIKKPQINKLFLAYFLVAGEGLEPPTFGL